MNNENKDILINLLNQHKELGISEQIDYNKFYLYSIITHSTAIEGSTVTEVEAQLLFDEGITSSKRTMIEQMMNLDLKAAYDYGMKWIRDHEDITVDWLVYLASKVIAGAGGKSYMHYQKVPMKLQAFCEELNKRRKAINPNDVAAVYDLSFWAHFELITIHPWADGNGRTCRLLMNLLQMEYGVLPTKVLKEDKAKYIQALIDTREEEDINIFLNTMASLHCRHLKYDIDTFISSVAKEMDSTSSPELVDKHDFVKELVDKWSIKPNLADKLADILVFMADKDEIRTEMIVGKLGFTETTAKRYLRQLTEFGYLEAHGGNKNRTYVKKA